jgi:excisionase family DNA binding protein
MTAPLLNAEQAGELLNVSKWWVRQEARANRIPHVRLGRSVRFDAQTLEDWWRARLQGPVPAPSAYSKGQPANSAGARHSSPPAWPTGE